MNHNAQTPSLGFSLQPPAVCKLVNLVFFSGMVWDVSSSCTNYLWNRFFECRQRMNIHIGLQTFECGSLDHVTLQTKVWWVWVSQLPNTCLHCWSARNLDFWEEFPGNVWLDWELPWLSWTSFFVRLLLSCIRAGGTTSGVCSLMRSSKRNAPLDPCQSIHCHVKMCSLAFQVRVIS